MNILVISDAWHPQVNGVVRTYENLTTALLKKGHKMKVISSCDFNLTVPMPFYSEIKLVLFPYSSLCKLIKKESFDYIHIATEGPLGWAARKYCRKNNLDYTTSYHTKFPEYAGNRLKWAGATLQRFATNVLRQFVRKFHSESGAVFVATESLKAELKANGFVVPMPILSRGVDEGLFCYKKARAFEDFKRPIALYVGRIATEKGLEDFLSMDWSGSKVIVGSGPCEKALAEKYKDAHFVGVKKGRELESCYCSSDVFVFPSKTDTFGLVIVEALACGLPVAGYNVTGPKDIITIPEFGALDDSCLLTATKAALNSKCSREERSKLAIKQYSWDSVSDQFLKGSEL